MFVLQAPNFRKRKSDGLEPTQASDSKSTRKRQKYSNDQKYCPGPTIKPYGKADNTFGEVLYIVSKREPSIFWDTLSVIHLTKSALRELERRTTTSTTVAEASIVIEADTYIQRCSAVIRADLQRFARQGGPDMSEAQGHPGHPLERARSSTTQVQRQIPTPTASDHPSTKTSSTRNSGPYSRNFQQHLTDHNIFHDEYEYPDGGIPSPPCNWEEIMERLGKPIGLQVTQEDYRRFKRADAAASKEQQVTSSVIPIIEGDVKDARCTSGGIQFRNLDPLTDGSTTPGNPDIFYGARPESLNQTVRIELTGSIVPTTQDSLPICPNFFIAIKGPDGSLNVAQRQALFDGALGARGMYNLQNYRRAQPTSNLASTITCIYHGGTLRMYTVYRTDLSGQPVYYMHQLSIWGMIANLATFRDGITAYRNARDWAEEQRNIAIEYANQATSPRTPITTRAESIFGSSPSDTAQYVTPPTGEQTTINQAKSKRTRNQMQSSSPAQHSSPVQQKRNRHHDFTATGNVGLSFDGGECGIENESGNSTEVLSSDDDDEN